MICEFFERSRINPECSKKIFKRSKKIFGRSKNNLAPSKMIFARFFFLVLPV